MKTHLLAITALFFILLTSSCQKKPSASFQLTKEIYDADELIQCSNESSNAYSLVWIVRGPMEFRGSANNFSFRPTIPGQYEITLACYSKNSRLSDKATKNIKVNSTKGRYTFYTQTLYGGKSDIYIDNVYSGSITSTYQLMPSCGATGCLTKILSPGVHNFQVVHGTPGTGDYSFTLFANQSNCNVIETY